MARTKDKEKALALRSKGYSYSMIKEEIGISKSTLSGWLRDFPLSDKRISELQSNSEIRIEKCRATKQKKKKIEENRFTLGLPMILKIQKTLNS